MESTTQPRRATATETGPDEVLAAGLRALDEALWQERAQLTVLALRAKIMQLVLAGDDRRWLERSVEDLADAARMVRAADHEPGKLVRAIGRHLGLGTTVSVRDVADAAPGDWPQRLRAHAAGLDRLATDIGNAERESRHLAVGGLAAVRGMLMALTGTTVSTSETYDGAGRAVTGDHHRVDGRI
ncbi:MAG: hypothetical protein AAGA17_08325 [Actinomycetota bacterium]